MISWWWGNPQKVLSDFLNDQKLQEQIKKKKYDSYDNFINQDEDEFELQRDYHSQAETHSKSTFDNRTNSQAMDN